MEGTYIRWVSKPYKVILTQVLLLEYLAADAHRQSIHDVLQGLTGMVVRERRASGVTATNNNIILAPHKHTNQAPRGPFVYLIR